MSLLIIGDSHLKNCNDAAAQSSAGASFNCNLKVVWKTDIEQVKHLEKPYKELSKTLNPEVVVMMCGGYDLALTNNATDVVNKLKAFVHYLNSSTVKFIIVCSLIERKCSVTDEEENANKAVRQANRLLAKEFKKMDKVLFINVRPPGKVGSFISTDKFHLKEEGYSHICKRILVTLEERVFPQITNATTDTLVSKDFELQGVETSMKKETIVQFKKEPSMDKRMSEFKNILVQDYKRICNSEDDLSKKFNKIKCQLDAVSTEKSAVMAAYARLFGEDLSQIQDDEKTEA